MKDIDRKKVEALAQEADFILYDEDCGIADTKIDDLTTGQIADMYAICKALADWHEDIFDRLESESDPKIDAAAETFCSESAEE